MPLFTLRVDHHHYFHGTDADPVLTALLELKKEVLMVNPAIAALGTRINAAVLLLTAGFNGFGDSLSNIRTDITVIVGKLEVGIPLTQDDLDALNAIGSNVEALVPKVQELTATAQNIAAIVPDVPENPPTNIPDPLDPPVVDQP